MQVQKIQTYQQIAFCCRPRCKCRRFVSPKMAHSVFISEVEKLKTKKVTDIPKPEYNNGYHRAILEQL